MHVLWRTAESMLWPGEQTHTRGMKDPMVACGSPGREARGLVRISLTWEPAQQ